MTGRRTRVALAVHAWAVLLNAGGLTHTSVALRDAGCAFDLIVTCGAVSVGAVRSSTGRARSARRAPCTRSGRTATMLPTTSPVITASPTPITVCHSPRMPGRSRLPIGS